jgi:hypothetical protein
MKILITILLALFISGNASAQDLLNGREGLRSIEEICFRQSQLIIIGNDAVTRALEAGFQPRIESTQKLLNHYAKIYHYLDCADFRK